MYQCLKQCVPSPHFAKVHFVRALEFCHQKLNKRVIMKPPASSIKVNRPSVAGADLHTVVN